ncbi:MAG: hypothetical protein IJV24_04685 [Prevotella sp.]|nr:hypothetical protein [Prevotella sp.]
MMKTKYASIGLLLAAMGLLNACTEAEEMFVPDFDQPTVLTLTMPADRVVTRATDPGVASLNENEVATIDLFLYPTGATEEEALVHLLIPKKDIQASEMTADGKVVNTFKASLSKSVLRQLFADFDDGTDLTCDAFALVNLPSSIKSANASNSDLINALTGYTNAEITSTKVSELKKLALGCTDFSYTEAVSSESSHMKGKAPLYFVMSGENSLSLDADKRELTGNIDVYRSAAKVSLKLTDVAETATTKQVVDGIETVTKWVSELKNITVRMRNVLNEGFVDAPGEHVTTGYSDKDNLLLNSDGTEQVDVDGQTETHHMFSTDMPLYTYPNDWSENATHRSSLIVCVRWKEDGKTNATWQNTYYEIPIDDNAMKLVRNTHYKIQLKIGVVGSFVETEPYLLDDCSYTILPWGVNPETGATMNQVRYLVVNTKEATMNNIIAMPIAYSSSHDIDKYSMKLEVRDLRAQDATWTELVKEDPEESQSTFSDWNTDMFRVVLPSDNEGNNIGNNQVVVEHDLVNNGDEKSHYSAFRMTFTLRHKDDPKYSETIVVYQYPMVYAEAEKNSGAGNETTPSNTYYGYMFVNGTTAYENNYSDYSYNAGAHFLGGRNGITNNAGNKNPNRYIIKATSLRDDRYIIGDPRLSKVNNDISWANVTTESSKTPNWTNYGYDMYSSGSNNDLNYYHPTEESDRTIDMISPSFMVASSYGVCDIGIPKQNARRRCASYQEDGYPAGRWRLPTSAEVAYIVQLSAWGKIPVLFGVSRSNAYYWTANGVIRVNADEGNSSLYTGNVTTTYGTPYGNSYTAVQEGYSYRGVSVRCVYDTWYWDDKIPDANKNNFTWGDKEDATYWGAQ